MTRFSDYFHHHWLSAALIVGTIAAVLLVYNYRDRIWIRGSGRK